MNLVGPLILFTKMMVLSFIIMWVRFSFPRFREDQLQRFAWKVLIPLSLANIVVDRDHEGGVCSMASVAQGRKMRGRGRMDGADARPRAWASR